MTSHPGTGCRPGNAAAADGATVAEVAKRARLSEGTTRNHLSQAMARTNVATRAEAVRLAVQKGWIVG